MKTKQTKSAPELRFPGFVGAWNKSSLGSETKWSSGGTPSKDNPSFWNGSIPWMSAASMHSRVYQDSPVRITEEGLKNGSKLAKNGSLLLLVRGSMLWNRIPVGIATRDVAFNQDVKALIPSKNVTAEFLLQWFVSSENELLHKVVGTGIGAGKLDTADTQNVALILPTLPEQRKIADFLTAVDGRIGQLIQKKALLEDYKKGVMQQLFTQAIRFKDDHGNDFPDWEEKKLGEVSRNVMYGMNAAAQPFDGVTKYIRITDIDESSNKFCPDPVTSPDEPAEERYKLQRGDIVFARTGASVGKSYLYDEADGNLAFAGFLIRFSIRQEVADAYFVYLLTQTSDYRKWVKINSMRSGQPGINAEEYKTLPFKLPSLPEQTKIADFLSALDRKIASVATQITETQTFKRGLLQQMFV